MPPKTSANPAASNLATIVGVALALLGALNLVALARLLWAGQVHAVHHTYFPPQDWHWREWVAPAAGMAALGLLIALLVIDRYFIDKRNTSDAATDRLSVLRTSFGWRTWLPAALAPVAAVSFISSPAVRLVALWIAVLLIAGTIAGLAQRWFGDSAEPEVPGAAKPDTGSLQPVRWWLDIPFLGLCALIVVLTVLHTWMQYRLYRGLQYGGPDIALFAEMLTNETRGRGLFCEAFGHHYFGEHISPMLYLLVPIWWVVPRIELLMLLGALAPLSAAVPLYGLVRVRGSTWRAAGAIALAFLLYPSIGRVIYGASYGFHIVFFATPLLLWAFYFMEQRRFGWMLVAMAGALACKENVAIVLGAFGLWIFLTDRSRRWGLVLLLVCIGYFLTCTQWLVPLFNAQGAYSKYYLYEGIGGSPVGIVRGLFSDPGRVVERLLSWRAGGFVLALLVPVGLVALRSSVILVAGPTLLFICLMDNPDFASIRFWHQSSILPVLWLAVVFGLTRKSARRRMAFIVYVLACAILTHLVLGFSPLTRGWTTLRDAVPDRGALVDRVRGMVPESGSVAATPRLAGHFYYYGRIVGWPQWDERPYPTWIVLDARDSFLAPGERNLVHDLILRLRGDGQFEATPVEDGAWVFRRRGPA